MNAEVLVNDAAHAAAPVDEIVISDVETLRALTDRQRLQIMEAFARNGGEPRTVKDVARELGAQVTKLYYHVNLLEQHGLLVVAGSRLVSGIVEKRYRPAARSFRVDRSLLSAASAAGMDAKDDVREALGNVLDSAADAVRAAISSRTFAPGDGRNLVSHGTMRLTPDQASRVQEALREIIETPDSTDEDAADYALTVALHPTATNDREP
jgi:hypothetical protein